MSVTQLLNRSDPDKILFTVTNAEGAQLTNGDVVEWDPDGTEGVSVEKTDTIRTALVCGVIVDTIDTGGVGRAQRWGYHSAVKTLTTATTHTTLGYALMAETSGCVADFAASNTANVTPTVATELMAIVGISDPGTTQTTTTTGAFLRL